LTLIKKADPFEYDRADSDAWLDFMNAIHIDATDPAFLLTPIGVHRLLSSPLTARVGWSVQDAAVPLSTYRAEPPPLLA
jgi:hypothetical protein